MNLFNLFKSNEVAVRYRTFSIVKIVTNEEYLSYKGKENTFRKFVLDACEEAYRKTAPEINNCFTKIKNKDIKDLKFSDYWFSKEMRHRIPDMFPISGRYNMLYDKLEDNKVRYEFIYSVIEELQEILDYRW